MSDCGAENLLGLMPAALDKIYKINRISLRFRIHFWPRKDAKLKSMIRLRSPAHAMQRSISPPPSRC